MYNLERFIKAQEFNYENALAEIKKGRKTSHWIWFIFPQLKNLGSSRNAKYYGIENLDEAKKYLENKILRRHLLEISQELLELKKQNEKLKRENELLIKENERLKKGENEINDDE